MVQCTKCRKYVHGSCDNEADLGVYAAKKETNPDYEYVCCVCKNLNPMGRQVMKRKDSKFSVIIKEILITEANFFFFFIKKKFLNKVAKNSSHLFSKVKLES